MCSSRVGRKDRDAGLAAENGRLGWQWDAIGCRPRSPEDGVCGCCARPYGARPCRDRQPEPPSSSRRFRVPPPSCFHPSPPLPPLLSCRPVHATPARPPHPASMGRRKIEIQPITHERNRSVTFLKRKNGLFKKAYELGVLCSVDVAVIVFEERPGHHVKLYQYCSTDVHAMVQRHLRFDGEKDTRTPIDFSSNKADDPADDDDDPDDDDPTRPTKRRDNQKQGKVKMEGSSGSGSVPIRPVPTSNSDMAMSIDLDYRNARISPANNAASIPISGERHNNAGPSGVRGMPMNAKRPRLASGHSDDLHGLQAVGGGMGVSPVGGSPTYPYRLDVDLGQYPSPSHISPLAPLAPVHQTMHAQYQSPGVASMLGAQGAGHAFLPQAPFDLGHPHPHSHSHHQPPTLRTVSFPQHTPSPYPPSQHGSYPAHRQGGQHAHAHAGGISVELLSTAAEHGNGHHAQAQHFPSFDWPVHAQQQTQQHENAHAPQPAADSNNWFDFLSGAGAGGAGGLLPPHARPASNSISSTRSVASYPVPPSTSSSEGPSPSLRHKRARDEDGAGASGSEYNEDEREGRLGGVEAPPDPDPSGRRSGSGEGERERERAPS
ncbi:hypothetical protein AcV5_009162 [Taiwanofungus camphoratus]|nr:hypothetical protein AcV5_009162 [Antrodia cinnamomea]